MGILCCVIKPIESREPRDIWAIPDCIDICSNYYLPHTKSRRVQNKTKEKEKVINMGLFSWADGKLKKLNIWDIGCIKWASLLLGVIIGAYIADFVIQYLWVFIVLTILLAIKPMYKMFR